MKKLPVDTSTFSRLIESNYLYIDKTEYIHHMLTSGHRFFLSRPRRFGKSLLVSTLKEILVGNKNLFEGLWVGSSDYEWKEYGVINLDFSRITTTDVETFKSRLGNILTDAAQEYNIALDVENNAPYMLEKIIDILHQRFGHVAILIDEYDSPILKTLHVPQLAEEVRNYIQHFFTIIKSLDAKIQFVFITGVSSFAKAGLFSGINNLQILTLDKRFAGICGYTDKEIDHYFFPYITQWSQKANLPYDEIRQKIKSWYNGYHFGKNVVAVYNPFSVMNALNITEFENFWFQSGTPTFLVDILKKEFIPIDITQAYVSRDFLGTFDVNNIPAIALMFQAGYLTIVDYDEEAELYKLDYPNSEVRVAFQKYLFEVFAYIPATETEQKLSALKKAFINQDSEEIIAILKQLFAHVPYQLHMKAEKYYHSLFMMICVGAGIKAQAEYSTSFGRIDLVLEFLKIIYIIEVKFNETAKEAMMQIEDRRYYDRFMGSGKQIILLGMNFNRKPKSFDIEYVNKIINN